MAPPKRKRRDDSSEKPVFDRVPPQNIEAERSVLGAMLINPDVIGTAIEILRDVPSDTFYVEAHQHLYQAVLELFRRSVPVDSVTLMEQMNKDGTLEAAGGVSYIAGLTNAVPTSANIEYYAKIVLEAGLLRKLISTCSRIAGEAYAPQEAVEKILDQAEAEIFKIAERRQLNPIHHVGDLLEEGIHRIEEQIKAGTGITGVPTGFGQLDTMLSGLQPSDMVILAARPSVGKTAFSLNIAANAAVHHKKRVIVFSLEMAKEQLVQRLLCMEGQVDSSRLRSGFLAKAEFPKLQRAAGVLMNAPLYIDDTPNISVIELRSKARRHAAQHGGVDLMIIDYLQLMSGAARAESRQVEISEISRFIKGLARELRCPVVALSQLSREAEKDDTGQPKLSHLRESGAIEQDADVVMMISRAPAHETEGRDNITRITIAKQRNGPTGYIDLLFEKNIQRFRSIGAPPPGVSPPDHEHSGPPPEDIYEEDDAPF
jgi:replicative DNA helicase